MNIDNKYECTWLTELEIKYMEYCRHINDYKGYSYSVYKIFCPYYNKDLKNKGVIKIKSEDIFSLYMCYPLKVNRYNEVLGNVRPCVINALVDIDGTHYERKYIDYEVKCHPKYLQINMYNDKYNNDIYLIELAVRDVIKYLNKLVEEKIDYGK